MMNKIKFIIAAFLCCCNIWSHSQNRNNIWIFGDSTGIDFNNLANPTPYFSANESRGTCASICDSLGLLQFYAYDPEIALWQSGGTNKLGIVKNKNHQKMPGGDSLVGTGWYHEMQIIPFSGNDSLFYLFHIGVTNNYGLYYSIVNINSDSVIQKKCSDSEFSYG